MNLSQKDLVRINQFAEKTAILAGTVLKEGFNKKISIKFKGRIDPVTEYDLKSERIITSAIMKKYPEHEIMTEEGSEEGKKSNCRWIIDPLDGTVNYSHGFPVYSVSIGFEYNKVPVVGVVFDPERNEMFSAIKGNGAYLNKKKIKVGNQTNLERSLLATGFAYDIITIKPNNLGYFARMAKKVQGIRRAGSAAIDLCGVAAGRLDGFWEFNLAPWDTCAAVVVLTEAGGKISKISGEKHSLFGNTLLAANPKLHSKLLAILNQKR